MKVKATISVCLEDLSNEDKEYFRTDLSTLQSMVEYALHKYLRDNGLTDNVELSVTEEVVPPIEILFIDRIEDLAFSGGYAEDVSTEELAEHYEALIGDPVGLSRAELIEGLRGSEFDEFAYK